MSAYDNEELFDFSPPLPPKLHQKAPPIPPKLKFDQKDVFQSKTGENNLRKTSKLKVNSPKIRSKCNTMVQNESYRFVEVKKIDRVTEDSGLIYENRNIIVSEVIDKNTEEKPKSFLTKIKTFFQRKQSKKKKSKDCNENDYFSSHKSENITRRGFSEISDEMCACSDINRSWYGSCRVSGDCRSNRVANPSNQFQIARQQHCHFNCVPVCQITSQCHSHHHQIINRCFNCQPCICNTLCHPQTPSFGNFTSFSVCSRSLQSNHDRPSIDNIPQESIVNSNNDSRIAVLPSNALQGNNVQAQEVDPLAMSLHANLQLLRKIGWYWGPLTSNEAEEIMTDRCDGTFIVRDSSHTDYLFSITFRVNNNTHHTRIQFSQNKFWLNQEKETDGFKTVIDLINVTVHKSLNGQFSYFQNIDNLHLPTYAVILLYPLSRFRIMTSLKHIVRFAIVSRVRSDHLDELPLPEYLISYLQDKDHHYVENFYHYVNIMKSTDQLSSTT